MTLRARGATRFLLLPTSQNPTIWQVAECALFYLDAEMSIMKPLETHNSNLDYWIISSVESNGRVNQKVAPWPGVLSTPTWPWCRSTIMREM
jgi:hypothetical protein